MTTINNEIVMESTVEETITISKSIANPTTTPPPAVSKTTELGHPSRLLNGHNNDDDNDDNNNNVVSRSENAFDDHTTNTIDHNDDDNAWFLYQVHDDDDDDDDDDSHVATHLKKHIPRDVQRIRIEEGVINLPSNAFRKLKSLKHVQIASTVVHVGRRCFQGCTSLECVEFVDKSQLVTVGRSAFRQCYHLQRFSIPDTVRWIGPSAFADCVRLTECIVPPHSQLQSLGSHAFEGTKRLSFLNLSNATSLSSIGEAAFLDCNALRDVGCIAGSVQTIGRDAFGLCDARWYIAPTTTTTTTTTEINYKLWQRQQTNKIQQLDDLSLRNIGVWDETLQTSIQANTLYALLQNYGSTWLGPA